MGTAKSRVADWDRRRRVAGAAREARPVSATEDENAEAIAAVRGNLTPAGVLALQRRVGNWSTVALLQRDGDHEVVGSEQAKIRTGAARRWGAVRGLVDESRRYNKPGKRSGPFVADVRIKAALGPERAAKFQELIEAREARQKKTTTAGGAYIASQMALKGKIGSTAAYTTREEREAHLRAFLGGAHAFVTNDAYLKIRGEHPKEKNFNAWGAGSNFVAPLVDADRLVKEASAEGGGGLFHLEESLGIPKGSWVKQCEAINYGIWRFKILDPRRLNLRLPSGSESGAYATWFDSGGVAHRGEWRPGGRTAGGATEAVIDQVGEGRFGESGDNAGLTTRNKLAELEKAGTLKVELDKSLSANTKRVLQEMDQQA